MNLRVLGRTDYVVAAGCGLAAIAVYTRTLAPTVYTFDSAEFATGAYVLGIIHATGYPLYLLLAKLFTLIPVGDIAFRVNLMSAVWGGATIALLMLLCARVTSHLTISGGSALLFAFSHYFWPEAVIAETYTLNTTLVLIFVLTVLTPHPRANLLAIGLVVGLGMANHMSTILVIPAFLYMLATERSGIRRYFLAMVGIAAGLALYLYLPIRYAADPPLNYAKLYFDVDLLTPAGVWSWASGDMFRPFMLGYDLEGLLGETVRYLGWLWENTLGAGVVIGIGGAAMMFRKDQRRFAFLALLYGAYTLFFINYRVVDKETMFSVSYLIWTVWIALGALAIHNWIVAARPRLVYFVPGLVMILALASFAINFRWADQSQTRQAREFASQLLDEVGPSAFVMTEWTKATPLEYLQIVEIRRPDVTIFDRGLAGLAIWNRLRREQVPDVLVSEKIESALANRIQAEVQHRPVYATEYDEVLALKFSFLPQGSYYRLIPLAGFESSPP